MITKVRPPSRYICAICDASSTQVQLWLLEGVWLCLTCLEQAKLGNLKDFLTYEGRLARCWHEAVAELDEIDRTHGVDHL